MPAYPEQIQHGSGATLTLEPGIAVASLRPGAAVVADARDLLASAGLVPVAAGPGAAVTAGAAGGRPMSRVNDSERLRWVRVQHAGGLPAARANIEATLGDRLEWLGPVYRFPGIEGNEGLVCPLPDALLVRAAEKAPADLDQRLGELGLEEDAARSRYLTPYKYFHVAAPKEHNAYELRDALLGQKDLVADVRLETAPMLVPTTSAPNDPLFGQQWGVQKIKAPDAWDITTGDAGTVVCVLDEGVDLTHPDLRFADPGLNLGTMLPDGRPTGNHGTACGGIAAALVNNGTGVAGVAGGCPILPLAFANWTDLECAAGIRYAADHGAAVISMSFGVYGPNEGIGPVGWDFSIIDPAIAYAHSKGVVLCAATGNENLNTFNRYPARNPLVIACGASDQVDNRKSPTSPDGETWWGANFAPGVTVVAPGVLIETTDRQGTAGYNSTPGTGGDYVANFNGTSSATPHVAGVAALIKSRNPALSNDEVRQQLERSADKVGTVPYGPQPGFPSGSRNNEMGYGRINARRALAMGRLEVFARGRDASLYHLWQTAPGAGWSTWAGLSGWIDSPVIGQNADGRLEVFVVGSDHALYHTWQTAAGGGWSGWAGLGGWIDQVSVGQNADGRLEVFARGRDLALYHIWQLTAGGGWSGWAGLSGWIDNPVVARNADGRLEVFVIGSDHALYHNWQVSAGGGWSGWRGLGGWIDRLAVGQNRDGRLEVFARGRDSGLYHLWQVSPGGGWSAWAGLGGWIDSPAVARNADGRLEVFVVGSDHALFHIWQLTAGGGWSGWGGLGGWVERPTVSRNADGRLEVHVVGSDHALYHLWQVSAGGGWSGWNGLGGWIDQLAAGVNTE